MGQARKWHASLPHTTYLRGHGHMVQQTAKVSGKYSLTTEAKKGRRDLGRQLAVSPLPRDISEAGKRKGG